MVGELIVKANKRRAKSIQLPTWLMLFLCYGVWGTGTYAYQFASANLGMFASIVLLAGPVALATTLHTSLQHEVLHGHPTRYGWLNEALVFPSLVIVYPFRRYRDLHLKHHFDANLTDPYDDPESYFWPENKNRHSKFMLALLRFNNTLVGRLLIGPLLGVWGFFRTEISRLVAGENEVRFSWVMHIGSTALSLFWIVYVCHIHPLLYLAAVVYPALSWLLLRSFAEHQAHEKIGARSAIVTGHPFFAFLYLNNNLHLVHHANPRISWYKLPALYRKRRTQYHAANDDYYFTGYSEIIRKFAFQSKQPVFHPLWHLKDEGAQGTTKQNAFPPGE